jgi:transposase
MKAHRCAAGENGGERNQAIGISRGGRTTKLHALTDEHGRPRAFALTGGQVVDYRVAELLLDKVPPGVLLLANRGYDTDAVRAAVNSGGATPNIPPKTNCRFKPPFSPVLYRARNAIERMFGRLKDFRRIAKHYDKRNRLPCCRPPHSGSMLLIMSPEPRLRDPLFWTA